jgi:hypothetical protein
MIYGSNAGKGFLLRANLLEISPKKAFSLAIRGGLKVL